MGVHSGSGKVFGWLANMTSIAGLMTWGGICVTYIRFYAGTKARGINRRTLPYTSRLQPYAAWYAAISCFIISLVGGASGTFHSQLDIEPKLSYTVQRLVCFRPWEVGLSHLFHKLHPLYPFPVVVRWREVLEEMHTCSSD